MGRIHFHFKMEKRSDKKVSALSLPAANIQETLAHKIVQLKWKKNNYKIMLRNLIKQMLNPSQASNNKHLLNLIIFKHIWASSNKNTLLKWYLSLRKFTEFMLVLLTSCWWNTEIMLVRLIVLALPQSPQTFQFFPVLGLYGTNGK